VTASALPNGKAPGPDGIPNEVLKMAAKKHSEYFADLFNRCVRDSHFPQEWKLARIVLVRKLCRPDTG